MGPKRSDWITVLVLLALAIGLGQLQNRNRTQGVADPVSRSTRALTSPGVVALDDVVRSLQDRWTVLADSQRVRTELDRLRRIEVAARMYDQTVRGLQREIAQLRAKNGLPDFGRQRIPARISGYFYYNNRFTLSVGSRQGVGVGMPVVGWQGLIGIVQTVEPDSSQAMLVSSPAVRFGGMVERDPEVVGLMRGQTPTRLVLDILDNGKVEVGDPVVTSGLSSRIPRGIPVGIVAEVVPDPNLGTRRVFVAPIAEIGPTLDVDVLK